MDTASVETPSASITGKSRKRERQRDEYPTATRERFCLAYLSLVNSAGDDLKKGEEIEHRRTDSSHSPLEARRKKYREPLLLLHFFFFLSSVDFFNSCRDARHTFSSGSAMCMSSIGSRTGSPPSSCVCGTEEQKKERKEKSCKCISSLS